MFKKLVITGAAAGLLLVSAAGASQIQPIMQPCIILQSQLQTPEQTLLVGFLASSKQETRMQ